MNKVVALAILSLLCPSVFALEPVSVSASADDGNIPANTLDGSLDTRWSANGDGQWIEYDLGDIYNVDAVELAFFRGDQRTANIDIQASSDGSNWGNVYSGDQLLLTTSLQTFDLADIQAQYIRVVGHGNSSNSWNSLTEVEIVASAILQPGDNGSNLAIETAFDDGSAHANYPASNAIDGSTAFASRWAAFGSPVNLTVQLEETALVTEVGIAWGRGDQRANTFEIYARPDTSGDWTRVFNGVSSGSTADIEYIDINDIEARQIRIKTHSNTAGTSWTDITEVALAGDAVGDLEDRSNWTLNASNNTDALAYAIDDDATTRWTTRDTQRNGQWISIDFGRQQTFNTINLNTEGSANDYARSYLVYATNNMNDWGSPLTLGVGAEGVSDIIVEDTTARYVKIVQTGLTTKYWWSIHDLSVSHNEITPIYKDWNISSLADLRDALTKSNQTIVMRSGYYNLSDLPSGERRLLLSGSNNTIDLEGVYVEVPVGSTTRESYFYVEGSNNTIIGGEFEDTYSNGLTNVTDFISYNNDSSLAYGLKGEPVMSIYGDGNHVNGLKLTIRGSFPYGYGSLFGIGAGSSFGLSKRCGMVVKGIGNIIENSQLIQRAFCHGIYLQSPANNTTVRNSYVEGSVRASNDMLAEGDGSLPYRNNYLDVDGAPIESDEVHSLSEDGIRVYNGGGSIVVENSTVKKMRGGIRLYLASSASVSNSVALDNGSTNWNMPKSGTVTNSMSNFTYAPVSDFRLSKSNQNLEITIEASPNAVGAHNIADVLGSDHTIVFHRVDGAPEDTDEYRAIIIYGNNSTIRNETEYDIVLQSGTSGNTVISAGDVTDNGSNNVSHIPLEL